MTNGRGRTDLSRPEQTTLLHLRCRLHIGFLMNHTIVNILFVLSDMQIGSALH